MNKRIIHLVITSFLLLAVEMHFPASAQLLTGKNKPTKADTVRGTYNANRSWWDVKYYGITVRPEFETRSLIGNVSITFEVLEKHPGYMQIDLQEPLNIEAILLDDIPLSYERLEQAYLVRVSQDLPVGSEATVMIAYSGVPRAAVNPPWDGGLIWTRDKGGNPWISVACQGLGASVWFPCKDHVRDEPDRGASISVTVPANMINVSNGRFKRLTEGANYNTFTWEVKNPINNYNITLNAGHYTHFGETYEGLNGPLALDYWVLKENESKARKHFPEQTRKMMQHFEYWFGPYPFYEDGFKLVETPFLGMEHQSAIAYGNGFRNGYLGTDLSGSGWGLKWDYIIVHEAGHEWFGNHISVQDVADLWVHEGFTTYSEVLYVESEFGKKAGGEYARGLRRSVVNDIPMIGVYDINREGSGDIYYKGVQLIHTYRQILNDDDKFRQMLHEMNRRFGMKTITTADVESLMEEFAGIPLQGFFDTYLRTTKVPRLEMMQMGKGKNATWNMRFIEVKKGFQIPVLFTQNGVEYRVTISEEWSPVNIPVEKGISPVPSPDYYIRY
ncbi:MAG: M1 family metallopeptidase [Flavobacteriales bacterium]|nr:M1 family metallopeptidase [Flavobacteriales bacterium]